MMSKARSEACLTPRKLRDLLESTTTNEELFTISLWALHLGGVYRKPKGDDPLMVSFIEVFLLAAIFGVLYAMLQLARR